MPLETWNVRSSRKLDSNVVIGSLADVILSEPLAHFARADTHNAVFTEAPRRVPAEDLHRKNSLLEEFAVAVEGFGYDVLKKILTPVASAESAAGDDTIQFLPHILLAGLTR